jgi:ribose transport system permease protein
LKEPNSLSLLVLAREWGIVALLAVLLIVFSIWAGPIFATPVNFGLIIGASALPAIYAAAIAMGVFSGALDLSVPGVAALSGIVMATIMNAGGNMWVAMVVAALMGGLVGLANGLIVLTGVNALAVTIGTLSVTGGLAAIISAGLPLFGLDDLAFIGTQKYFGVPGPVIVVFIVYVILTIFLTQTRGGTRYLAAGGNPEALRRVGVNVRLFRVMGFVISGLLAGVAGILTAAITNQASPTAAVGQLFIGLTAVALSGISLAGGRGSLPKVWVGALIISTIASALVIMNVQPYVTQVVTGLLLIVALTVELVLGNSVSKQVAMKKPVSAHKESSK